MTQAKDLTHLLSQEALSRNPSRLKSAFKYYSQEGMSFLGGGLPLPDYFPFDKIIAEVPTPGFANGIGAKITDADKTVIEINKRAHDNDPQDKHIELARSLQYGFTEGHTELVEFLKEHTRMIHNVPYKNWNLITSVGSTEGWESTLRTFVNRGDSILVEEYTFASALETAHAQGINTIPVPMDSEGLIPDALATVLDGWTGPKPKLLYTICTGQNPTGSSLSTERRHQIYEIAKKHDILIIEDEPYYFLQMETYTRDKALRESKKVHSHEEFVKAMVPSFISIDTEGRVIRLDSFSKVLAPGIRIGWIVGQDNLLERFTRYHEVSIQNPSGIAQSLTNGVLQKWGQPGYLDWLIGLRAEYTHKRDVAIDAMVENFPEEVVSYVAPVAGMFFAFNIDASKHPKFVELGSDPLKIELLIYEQAIKQGSLMIPGSWFKADGQSNPPQKHLVENPRTKTEFFFRGTYAAIPLDELKRGIEKFGKAIKIEFGLI
ncbi:aromatic amino acid aminotransferase [Suhomyces tanzawaensis NRRL Y-17324]|uniref:aromatic-amino-acid transaminase n=1 Tax=Suhomyces tanzawaensis NRRL Y-17324 TaxID=984487 RepID=A0A1E4SJH9_9ASCO|nr:aromatic amino acid aminotransferase [Suhomyces tanzawaensis NRRL Y-17324]ODV79663.1 aromatic amino acid aminotransferase [Suhomyces tanzawaensis NRRL Y-17324]